MVLASASSTGADTLSAQFSGSPPLQLSSKDADVAAFDLGPDGTSVVFGTVRPATHNTSVFFAGASMDAGPAVRIAQLDGVAVKSVAWSPDGSLVSIGAEDTRIAVQRVEVVHPACGRNRSSNYRHQGTLEMEWLDNPRCRGGVDADEQQARHEFKTSCFPCTTLQQARCNF